MVKKLKKEVKKKKSVKVKVKEEVKNDISSFLSDYMLKQADIVEKEENLASDINDSYRLPTSLLVLNILMDGGISPTWYSVAGEEQSSKSACALTCAKACADKGVPLIYYMDAEAAVKKKFVCSIFGVDDVSKIFGKRDEKGNYLTRPLVRYSPENRLEKVFGVLKKVLLRLPDKMYNASTGKWYYVFDRTAKAKKQISAMNLKDFDKKLYQLTGSYWFEAPDDTLQFFGVIDSLVALVPSEAEEDEDKVTQRIANLALPLSTMIPQLKGLLKRKHASIFVVNQMRDKPMVMFGPKEGEPGGRAAKFFSDFRLKFTPRVPNGSEEFVKSKTKATCIEEPSVEGNGTDRYMLKSIDVIKSKTSEAGDKTFVRVWVKDFEGKPRGYDPVYDAWRALVDLRLVSGSIKRSFKVNLPGVEDINFDWLMFKYCILIEVKKSKTLWLDFCKKYKPKFSKPLKIRKQLADLIAKGNLEKYKNKASEVEADVEPSLDDAEEL